MIVGNKEIKERDDMIYGRTKRNENRIKEINNALMSQVKNSSLNKENE